MEQVERAIIGGLIITTNEKRIDAIISLEKVGFDNETYASLYSTIKELTLQKKEVDVISVYKTNQNVKAPVISKITAEIYSDALLESHILLLKDHKFKKDLEKIISTYQKEIRTGTAATDLDELKNSLIADLSGLMPDDKVEFENIKEYKRKIEEQFNSGNDIEGYSWGIKELDAWTSGINSPFVYVIGGLKKSGKTRFVIYLITQLLKQKVQNSFLSLEMPAYEVVKLLHSSMTGINDIRFRKASTLKREEIQEFRDVEINEKIFGLECKSGLTLEKILSRIRRFSKMGVKVIFIDYIQRISHDRNRQAQELENIAIRLADSARQNNVALILLSQLNALGEKEVPNLGHLKGSGGIGEAADTIILFDNVYRRTKDEKIKNQIDLYLEQRHGDSGLLSIHADLGSCRFQSLADAKQKETFKNEVFI